ncbi:jg9260 [Pararge aegeria aegeria]|uniref:Jg9260 protein n=1 Tax=Pararge aegeria aegeria TaxID=348720 RepID=A0A8S4SKC3_9NEOP|nr:jg9260 [Pararge aegeria aegeria]
MNYCFISSDGGFLERALRVPFPYVDESESESAPEQAEDDTEGVEGAVYVHLSAGPDGRFGFNVRGGGNGVPVLVSRVAPRTRVHLQEGDQVISINGKDVNEMTHEQVVQMIRNTKGVLTLLVKPNDDKVVPQESSSGATRNVTQLQYTAWPDHGVPEDSTAFIEFTQLCSQLRNHRAAIPTVVEELVAEEERVLEPPMIVHCSAGVGRTGALILAETALELLARRQPLYPLDLVRNMRTQRPMCIQNASQYKFVCESIQAAYSQGISTLEKSTN